MEKLLKLESINAGYEQQIILKDINLEVNKRDFIGIIGPNGGGKTTLLKSIAGLIDFEGTVTKSTVTYVSQHPTMFHMSVLDNILYPIKVRKLDKDLYIQLIEEYAKTLELTDLLDVNATTLSAGEKMKTSIIRSIIFNPDFVLLDEPTTSLDEESIKELTQLLKSLKQSIGFIIVSHDRLFKNDLMDVQLELGGDYVQRQVTK